MVLVLKSSLSEAQKKKLLETIKSWLKDVKIVKEEDWGKKPLSYSIKKETAGLYLNYQLEAKDLFPLDFEKKLMSQDDVLRHLLLRTN